MEHSRGTTRRGFLVRASGIGLGAVSLACPALPRLLAGKTQGRPAGLDVGAATCADFLPHLGSSFRLQAAAGAAVDVELIRARPLPARSQKRRVATSSTRRKPFSLVFRAAGEPNLAQQTVRVTHQRLGTFDLFIVRLRPDSAGRMRYEAIFG
jgi:hypothetical protein